VEEYLRGVLWVVQMYTDGVCPDVSYTYMGRPPISPFLVSNYISKLVWKNCLLAGIDEFDVYSTVQHLFRSLHPKDWKKTIEKSKFEMQLRKLQSMILDGKIGVDIGGVSYQDLKTRIYVPRSSWRLSEFERTFISYLTMILVCLGLYLQMLPVRVYYRRMLKMKFPTI
jgi:hypothetical protein